MTIELPSRAELSRVRESRERILEAWRKPSFHDEVWSALKAIVPESEAGGLTWRGPNRDQPHFMGQTTSWDPRAMKYVTSGQVLRHRPYDPSRPSAFHSNRVSDFLEFEQRWPKAAAPVRAALFQGTPINSIMRTVLYDAGTFVAHVAIVRDSTRRGFTARERAAFGIVVPTLLGVLASREIAESRRIGGIADLRRIIDSIPEPAFVFDDEGRLQAANDDARRCYDCVPEWVEALIRSRSLLEANTATRCTELKIDNRRYRIVLPREVDVRPEQAGHSMWAKQWKLRPRWAEAAAWVIRGLGDEEIAERMGLSVNSARTYVRRILESAGVTNRNELFHAAKAASGLPVLRYLDDGVHGRL